MNQLKLRLLDSSFSLTGPAAPLGEIAALCPAGEHDAAISVEVQLHDGDEIAAVLTLLNQTALAQCRSFAVHAGVVSAGGHAIAFPAESGSGKSTLTAACLRTGFGYLSDEALVVDWTSGRVRSYPKWLSLSGWSARQVGLAAAVEGQERPWTAADLGGAVGPPTAELAHVVLLDRRPGEPELVPVSQAEAARQLLELSFNHYQRPAQAFALAATLARGAQAWTLGLSDPVAAAELLADALR